MTFVIELGTALAASLLAEGAKATLPAAKGIFEEAKERIVDGSLGVFVFGPQGAGKSTLRMTLSGERKIFDPTPPYISSPVVEKSKTAKNRFYFVQAGPGQLGLAQDQWPNMLDRISRTKRALCIYCGSYGFESPWAGSGFVVAPDQNGGVDFEKYTAERRATEREQLDLLCASLAAYRGSVALQLLITKQDLWWSRREEVQAYYDSLEIARTIDKLSNAKKRDGFAFDKCSVSLSLENLLSDVSGEVLAGISEGYDQRVQAVNYLNFKNSLRQLLQW
jgi:hypothetical protein